MRRSAGNKSNSAKLGLICGLGWAWQNSTLKICVVNIWKLLVIMCVWIIYSLSCNLQIQIIISDQVLGLTSGEIIAAYISERMTCALYHPPTLLLCHSFKTKRKEDLLLPPTHLKGQCHSIRRCFFMASHMGLVQLIYQRSEIIRCIWQTFCR